MKDYSEMSDSDINKEVALKIGIVTFDKVCGHPFRIIDDYVSDVRKVYFRPCDSWADAGPIIEKNAIGIMPFKKGESEAWSLSAGLLSNTKFKHDNPLRAAMIVFLMMQESK